MLPLEAARRAMLESFERAQWGTFLLLMAPYSLFFCAVDSLVVRQAVSWFNVPVRYRDVFPIRATTYILTLLNTQVGQGGLAVFLHKRYAIPFWQITGTVLVLLLVEVYQLAFYSFVGAALTGELEQHLLDVEHGVRRADDFMNEIQEYANSIVERTKTFEYDDLADRYARFLIEEIIPALAKDYALADDRKMRAVCGESSGGICAFTVAWQRPDVFHKVVSHIGSFTNIRGGHEFPAMIRRDAKRDIKVFLQDGSGDLDNRFGSWWLANQQMAAALAFRGYEFQFAKGTGGHDGKHGGAILPDTLRWLWSDVKP